MMEYVKGQGWVYAAPGPVTLVVRASGLEIGDSVIRAWDEEGNTPPWQWHSFPYRLRANDSYAERTIALSWWVKAYPNYTFEVTRG
jgi:hypothetical protein